MTPQVSVDVLGEPWTAETIGLPPDEEGPVVATLVSRRAERSNGRAVLHVHGFADYFFQTEYADWWLARGYDFYALDLRKYGRSIRPHQTPTFITDLHDYFAEIDLAWWRITTRDGFSGAGAVVLSGHSTGGLVTSLWSHHRQPDELGALVLNAPWFDMQGPPWMRTAAAGRVLDRVGQRRPMGEIKRTVDGGYGRSLHRDYAGEWDFDLTWKPIESFPVRFGWLRAVRAGHAEVHAGLSVLAPVLVLSSAATLYGADIGDAIDSHDVVLDVPQIRRWSASVGPHVTYVAIDGARHDVVLSLPPVRAKVYDELERWVTAYVGR